MWNAAQERIDDGRAHRGVIICGMLGLKMTDELDNDKLWGWMALKGLTSAAYNRTSDHIIYKSDRMTADSKSTPFLHSLDVELTGIDDSEAATESGRRFPPDNWTTQSFGKNTPLSATFVHDDDN
jgi:hypothetical protein